MWVDLVGGWTDGDRMGLDDVKNVIEPFFFWQMIGAMNLKQG